MFTLGLSGAGVVGDRVARRLPSVLAEGVIVDLDGRSEVPSGLDVVVLASGGPHAVEASRFIEAGVPVVSIADDLADVRALLDLDDRARAMGVPLVVGAGMAPGLSELLARLLVSQLATCDEIHIAVHGTAGPACARQQHRALRGRSVGYRDGSWIQPPAGSGRELCYFPEPVGPYDCYRAELASPVLLRQAFPQAVRLSARVSANRRDRLTAWLPMLSPPHREGGVGAIRVEVRGADADGGRQTLIAGVAELVGTASAATAISFASAIADGALPAGVVTAGDADLDTTRLLKSIALVGIRLQEFTGVPSARRISANP